MPTIVPFGVLPDGRRVDKVELRAGDIALSAITYGAIIVSIRTPDRDGRPGDIVLGHDGLASYLTDSPYFGAVIGRYANRIAGARFTLNGAEYRLSQNENGNCLHGGLAGFDKMLWTISELSESSVTFSHVSPSGDQGFPGRLSLSVTYTLNRQNELLVTYIGETDAPTVLNLTQHTYWNLAGPQNSNVLGHELAIHASNFTPVGADLIPTGELAAVQGTPFDFREPAAIGARIHNADAQLQHGLGYDHNFVLDSIADGLREAAALSDPVSGRTLRVSTTEPGIQLYTGNRLDGSITGKAGIKYGRHAGLCLETQHFPDSPNRAEFPSTTVYPGTPLESRTVFGFEAT